MSAAARSRGLSAWAPSSSGRSRWFFALEITAWMARGGLALRSEEHTSELQSQFHLVCRLLLEKKKPRCPLLADGAPIDHSEGRTTPAAMVRTASDRTARAQPCIARDDRDLTLTHTPSHPPSAD